MTTSDSAFGGSVPAVYERDLVPMMFRPYAENLAERIRSLDPHTLLETAAGTGVVTRELDRALDPSASITATDLNQAMIAIARSGDSGDRIRWGVCDATVLPFDDGAFDTVACQFGVMFFPDKVAAFRDAHRVLASDGSFVFSVWDRIETNDLTLAVDAAMSMRYPDDPPGFIRRTPFGYFDTDNIRSQLAEAGFGSVDFDTVALRGSSPSALAAATGICQGTPLRFEIDAREPSGLQSATDAAADVVAERLGSGAIESAMQAIVVTARP